MNAMQTGWLVDETGRDIVVKEVFRPETLSGDVAGPMQAIPCPAKAPQQTLISENLTPSQRCDAERCLIFINVLFAGTGRSLGVSLRRFHLRAVAMVCEQPFGHHQPWF